MSANIPASWVSIDPGDRHVGWAEWVGRNCINTLHLSPEECVQRLEDASGFPRGSRRLIELVVCEKWALYAWNEESMAGNEFLTSQLIGMIKYICNRAGIHFVGQFAAQGKLTFKREPWKSWTVREWKQALGGSIGPGEHRRDAYAHGQAFIWGRDHS